MKKLVAVLLLSKIGFIANEAVTGLKLLEKGFKKEDLALTVLLDFPLQLFIGYKAAKYARDKKPLAPVLHFLGSFHFYCCLEDLNSLLVLVSSLISGCLGSSSASLWPWPG